MAIAALLRDIPGPAGVEHTVSDFRIEVSPAVPVLVAFVVSFFTSMGGVSGAFLLLPFQMSVLGYTHPSVSATNQMFNVVAIPSGVYRYFREGRLVWPLTLAVIIGTLPGVFIGAIVRIGYLPDARNFKLFADLVMAYVGIKMVKSPSPGSRPSRARTRLQARIGSRSLCASTGKSPSNLVGAATAALPAARLIQFSFKRIKYADGAVRCERDRHLRA